MRNEEFEFISRQGASYLRFAIAELRAHLANSAFFSAPLEFVEKASSEIYSRRGAEGNAQIEVAEYPSCPFFYRFLKKKAGRMRFDYKLGATREPKVRRVLRASAPLRESLCEFSCSLLRLCESKFIIKLAFVLAVAIGLLAACGNGTTDGDPITVTVNPSALTVSTADIYEAFGSYTKTFTATVTGTGNKAVVWSIPQREGLQQETNINAGTGMLTISSAENTGTFTVRATSKADTSKHGEAIITITAAAVANVTILPASDYYIDPEWWDEEQYIHVAPGDFAQFEAVVADDNGNTGTVNQSVVWSIPDREGLQPETAFVSRQGNLGFDYTALEISVNETPGTRFSVRATSAANPDVFGEAAVVVGEPYITRVILEPPQAEAAPGGEVSFYAGVFTTGKTDTGLEWEIIDGVSGISIKVHEYDPWSAVVNVGDDVGEGTVFTVMASSKQDSGKYAQAEVEVVVPEITGVEIELWSQDEVVTSVVPGREYFFNWEVTGRGPVSQDVTWGIIGTVKPGTEIVSSPGFMPGQVFVNLLVDAAELPGTTFTVRAASKEDTSKWGEVALTVVSP